MTFKDAIAASILASALALPAGSASAQSLGQSFFSKLLGTSDDQPAINYSERAPLVLPGKLDMPPPKSKEALAQDPDWPKDPDEQKRKKASADSRGPASNNTELLGADEMAVGTRTGSASKVSAYQQDQAYEHMSNPVNPKVLARRGSFLPDAVPLDPTVCPPRRSLVDPPGCINKPSANAPLAGNEPLPSEAEAEANKPWYQKVWKFGGGGD